MTFCTTSKHFAKQYRNNLTSPILHTILQLILKHVFYNFVLFREPVKRLQISLASPLFHIQLKDMWILWFSLEKYN